MRQLAKMATARKDVDDGDSAIHQLAGGQAFGSAQRGGVWKKLYGPPNVISFWLNATIPARIAMGAIQITFPGNIDNNAGHYVILWHSFVFVIDPRISGGIAR